MKYKVKKHIKFSEAYLRRVARLVVSFIKETDRYEPSEESAFPFIPFNGPDGLLYSINYYESDLKKNDCLEVVIEETAYEIIELSIPIQYFDTYEDVPMVAPWASHALDVSDNTRLYQSTLTGLAFGYLPIGIASILFNVPLTWIISHFDASDSSPSEVLRASITHSSLRHEKTLVDVRGLIAWLILTKESRDKDIGTQK